jgi:hypothetical protein
MVLPQQNLSPDGGDLPNTTTAAKNLGQKRKASEMDDNEESADREQSEKLSIDEDVSDDEWAKDDPDYQPSSESDADMDNASYVEGDIPHTPSGELYTTFNSNNAPDESTTTTLDFHD